MTRPLTLLLAAALLATASSAFAAEPPRFVLELEAGPVWQTSNDVQIPNDETGTRFSLEELVGSGPWPAGRLYATWNINQRHGLRLLLAPLSYTETGTLDGPVDFAGASYQPGVPTEATYRFNSWRLTWRYRLKDGERWQVFIGATAKIRDAEIRLRQGEIESFDDDLGFVPLLHLAAEYRLADRWRLIGDLDALAGGPGRAIDLALKLGYDVSDRWSVTAGYRTVEGGADTDDVYSFAWFNAAVVSGIVRF
ncbi:MAG: hypothetical protein MUC56_11450 [Thermoanaerobaculales bacterium]|jgi:hypothetical protein|nr:hypothetical protein [Thermoanaerobaculales bacterium]